MNETKVVAEVPQDYLGSATTLEGAKLLLDIIQMFGQDLEIVQHEGTFYVVPSRSVAV